MCCKAHNGGTGWGSHQLELDVGRVDAAEHGNLLGGQLRGEHTSPDPRHPSYTSAGRRHLLQHRAWHLDGHTHTHTCYHTIPGCLGAWVRVVS